MKFPRFLAVLPLAAALLTPLSLANAKPDPALTKAFVGKYRGSLLLTNAQGERLVFSPLTYRIRKNGRASGRTTLFDSRTSTTSIARISGKLKGRVHVRNHPVANARSGGYIYAHPTTVEYAVELALVIKGAVTVYCTLNPTASVTIDHGSPDVPDDDTISSIVTQTAKGDVAAAGFTGVLTSLGAR